MKRQALSLMTILQLSGTATCALFQAALQAIKVGEALFPTLMAGFDVDMPGLAENADFSLPMAC
jgi:hypothetical protein